jgi:hypothetical protein
MTCFKLYSPQLIYIPHYIKNIELIISLFSYFLQVVIAIDECEIDVYFKNYPRMQHYEDFNLDF